MEISNRDYSDYSHTDFNDNHWKDITIGQKWQQAGYNQAGYGWYRLHYKIPKEMIPVLKSKDKITLSLGYMDDIDWIYFNGKLIGVHGTLEPFTTAYSVLRKMDIDTKYINTEKENVIAVRIYSPDTIGAGMYSGPYNFYFGEEQSINEFRYWVYSYPSDNISDLKQDYGFNAMQQPQMMPFIYPAGTRTQQFIAADPTGQNNDGNFRTAFTKYIDQNGEAVIFDQYGPGCLYRQQMNIWKIQIEGIDCHSKVGDFWTGSGCDPKIGNAHIKYYFDDQPIAKIDMTIDEFFSGKTYPFTEPLCFIDGIKRFANLYYPFPFKKRLKVTVSLEKTYSGYIDATWYQYTYVTFAQGTNIESWNGKNQDSKEVRRQWNNLGSDPKPASDNKTISKTFTLSDKESKSIKIDGQGSITSIKINLEPYLQSSFYFTTIRIYWDDQKTPSVELPLSYFFGCGGQEFGLTSMDVPARSLQSLLMGYSGYTHSFYSYFPMPFGKMPRSNLTIKAVSLLIL